VKKSQPAGDATYWEPQRLALELMLNVGARISDAARTFDLRISAAIVG
jgi:hypothetical protein